MLVFDFSVLFNWAIFSVSVAIKYLNFKIISC